MSVTVHLGNSTSGKKIFEISTISAGFFVAPIHDEGSKDLYYVISGSGGSAQLYSWVA